MKNAYEIRGDVTAIFIDSPKYGRMETLIDTADLDKASSFPNTWFVNYQKKNDGFYIGGKSPKINGKRKPVLLHRWVTDCPDDKKVDHFNHNTMDNRRSENLRVVTNAENMQNLTKPRSDSKSGMLGVSWYKRYRKWSAQIVVKGKSINLGYFDDIEEAERIVKEARFKYMPFSQEARAVSVSLMAQ